MLVVDSGRRRLLLGRLPTLKRERLQASTNSVRKALRIILKVFLTNDSTSRCGTYITERPAVQYIYC